MGSLAPSTAPQHALLVQAATRYVVGLVGATATDTSTSNPVSLRGTPSTTLACYSLALLVLGAALLFPIWSVAIPPLLDYPNHLARCFVLAHLHDPAFSFSKFYRSDWGFYPYLGMDAFVVPLLRLFPVETAGRVFLSVCVLAFPAAAWFFLREVNPGEDLTALWALLAAYNMFFLEGMLNFDLGLAGGFLTLALWLRWLKNPATARWIVALVAFTALYFTHLLAFGLIGFIFLAYLASARRPLREWIWTSALALPGIAFYLYSSRVGLGKQAVVFRGLAEKFAAVGNLLHSDWQLLDWISLAMIGVYILAAWWRNSEFRWGGKWLGVGASLFVLFLALPWAWGDGSDLDVRALPVLFVVLFATFRAGRRLRWLALIPLLLFAGRTVTIARQFKVVQPDLQGLARSFDAVPRGALVLPIVEGDQYPTERYFTHFWAYGVIRRGWFSPYLFDLPGQTPMRIVYNSYTPDGFWNLAYDQGPDWKQVQSDYDYVWAYGVPRFSAALAEIGDRVYSYGPLEVYRVRKPSAALAKVSRQAASAN